ncbi:MAG: HEPN domain-containing protein [Thermoanaerobaculia bacterium]
MRARKSLESAAMLAEDDPDAAASRAYYAAFYAVSGLLAEEGHSFRKHSAVETAVHRDLVRTGRWTLELGEMYSRLQARRVTGDYGGELHVSSEQAAEAVAAARRILEEVLKLLPPHDQESQSV